jgi:predicted ABC-type ATPase
MMEEVAHALLGRIRDENLHVYGASAQRLREDVGQESQIAQDYRGRLIYLRHIQKWRLKGYRVSLFFLALPNVETAIARVAERVRQGGHNIPEPVIRRRFYSGWWNFTNAYQAAVDDWAVHDNSGNMPVLVEWEEAQ